MKWLPSLRRETLDGIGPPSAAAGETVDPPDRGEAGASPPEGDQIDSLRPTDGTLPDSPTETSTTVLTPEDVQAITSAMSEAPGPAARASEVVELLAGLRQDMVDRQQALGDGQRNLNDLFMTRLRSDEAQTRAFEKLHDELRDYKANFVRRQMLPLLKEVVFCHDFLSGEIERLHGSDAASADPAAIRALETARQMLIDMMFKYDIEPYRAEGETFDPKWQQCARVIPTGRADADKTIAARGREGFRSPEAILRREQVSIYKFTPGAD